MRKPTLLRRALLTLSAAVGMLSLTGCGAKQPEATPTMSVNAIYTAAFQTLEAQQATQKALTPPTGTPTDTPFPTLPSGSTIAPLPFGTATTSGGGAVAGCDNAVFVADITIPDGTEEQPGQKFVKTWSLLNKGSCNWSNSYKLAFLDGDQMGGAATPLAQDAPAGSLINISVSLTAPDTAGSYTGRWQMENASNQRFGDIVTVVIKVGATATTPGATDTPGTPAASATPTETITATP